MTFDEIEELIRKYLSTGIAVVVILVAPGTGHDTALPGRPEVVTIEPGPSGTSPSSCEAGRRDGGDDNGAPAKHLPGTGSTTGANTDTPDTPDTPGTSGSDSPSSARTGASGTDPGSESAEDSSTDTDTNCDAGAPASSNDERSGNRSGDDNGSGPDSGSDNGSGSDSDRSGPASGPGSDNGSNPGTDTGSERSGSTTGSGSSDSAASADNGTSAAEVHGWGTPNREDDFSGGADQWNIYDGPGHAGQGTRSPSAVSLNDGILTITGNSSGTTAGMAWNPGQKYGRWEGRVKAPASDPSYNALLLMWPDAEDFPVGGEIDFMEMMDHTRQQTDLFLHYGADNSQVNGSVEIDATQWHNWGLEWTPEAITAYVDGKEWYRTTDKSIFPPGPMHLCIQLDWFPQGDNPNESTMMVDWVRQYSLDGGDTSDSGSTSDKKSGHDGSNAPAGFGNKNDKGDAPILDAIRRMFSWR